MHFTVYQITNKINGKIYIGKHQTKDLNDSYMGSGKMLKRAQKKYGIENFSKEILFNFGYEELMNAKEAELVTEDFCLREDTYNLCSGGQGGFSFINRLGINGSKAGRTKGGLSQADQSREVFRLRNSSKEWHKKRVDTIYERHGPDAFKTFAGQKHTDSAKEKMRLNRQSRGNGAKNSQFGSMWITDGIQNKKIKNIDHIPDGWYKGRKMKI